MAANIDDGSEDGYAGPVRQDQVWFDVKELQYSDSDSEADLDEVAVIKAAHLGTFEEPPPHVRKFKVEANDVKDAEDAAAAFEYHNVSVDDIERRLALSYAAVSRGMISTSFGGSGNRWYIDPRGKFARQWDIVLVFALAYTCIVSPFEVAYVGTSPSWLFGLNRALDVIFFSDTVVNLFLAYFETTTNVWVFDNKLIAAKYAKSWLFPDIISTIPFELISESSDSQSQLKALRLIRLLRLMKMTRIVRASRLWRRIETTSDISYNLMTMSGYVISITLVVHWVACVWNLTAVLEDPMVSFIHFFKLEDTPLFDLYIIGLSFSVQALAMGPAPDIYSVTATERIVSSFCMVINGAVFAYVLGAVCGVVSTLDPASIKFENMVDTANEFMEEARVDPSKRREIREFFQHCRPLFRSLYFKGVMDRMSPTIQADVALHVNAAWVQQIRFFRAPNPVERGAFIAEITTRLRLCAFTPFEFMIRKGELTERMFIIKRGLASRLGRVFSAKRFVGEDMILHATRRRYAVKALTFVDAHCLTRRDMESVLSSGDFPQTQKLIRAAAIRLSLARTITRIAEQRAKNVEAKNLTWVSGRGMTVARKAMMMKTLSLTKMKLHAMGSHHIAALSASSKQLPGALHSPLLPSQAPMSPPMIVAVAEESPTASDEGNVHARHFFSSPPPPPPLMVHVEHDSHVSSEHSPRSIDHEMEQAFETTGRLPSVEDMTAALARRAERREFGQFLKEVQLISQQLDALEESLETNSTQFCSLLQSAEQHVAAAATKRKQEKGRKVL